MRTDLPHESEIVFFVDRDLGGKVFHSRLEKAGISFEKHEDHFKHDTPDDEWIKEIGKRGWYIVTHDKKIRHRLKEINAVENNNAGMFILVGTCPHIDLANNFLSSKLKILRFIRKHSRPFIAKIYRSNPQQKEGKKNVGYIELWKSF